MLTPHMTELARELSCAGAEVHYVTEEALSEKRRAMGWKTEDIPELTVHYINSPKNTHDLVDRLPAQAVHISQGVRANGLIAHAQKRIMDRGLRHYPIMEKVDLRGTKGWFKPFIYALRFRSLAGKIEGILAIGETTPAWIAKRSSGIMRPIPFAYFLKARLEPPPAHETGVFRFIFVGSLINLKRVDLLFKALSGVMDRPFAVEIVGDGTERARLERQVERILPGRVLFTGTVDMDEAIKRIAVADCLVLPSAHDGWGAVASEAQINGTPVICSSECGVAGTVRASSFGGVFEAGNANSLRQVLAALLDNGPLDAAERERLSNWARSLTAETGAGYLLDIIRLNEQIDGRIVPPWERTAP